MREVFGIVANWLDEGRSFALATLVELRDAAPAPLGTTVAVDRDGTVFGNIGAGCYESDIVVACMKTAADGEMRRLDINLTGDDVIMGGTACGAAMQLVVWRPGPEFAETARAIASGEREVRLSIAGFEHVFERKTKLIAVGATAVAAELAMLGRRLDFDVVVIEPRPSYATKERIPDAEIVRAWPDDVLPRMLSETTPIVVLSHDPKFDLPALRCALRSNAPYIGLLGSRRSQAARRASLQEEGFDDAALARIHGPVGLDLGGVTVAETALSILAEVVASRRGGEGAPLTGASGAIHHAVSAQSEAPYCGTAMMSRFLKPL